jgi:hypothetical protein
LASTGPDGHGSWLVALYYVASGLGGITAQDHVYKGGPGPPSLLEMSRMQALAEVKKAQAAWLEN